LQNIIDVLQFIFSYAVIVQPHVNTVTVFQNAIIA